MQNKIQLIHCMFCFAFARTHRYFNYWCILLCCCTVLLIILYAAFCTLPSDWTCGKSHGSFFFFIAILHVKPPVHFGAILLTGCVYEKLLHVFRLHCIFFVAIQNQLATSFSILISLIRGEYVLQMPHDWQTN